MKKSSVSVMALLAILFAVGSAFTAKISAENKAARQSTSYYWYKVSTGAYQGFKTQTAEQPVSGCSGSGSNCERGYDKLQLNNQNDPNQGVISTEVTNQRATITKS